MKRHTNVLTSISTVCAHNAPVYALHCISLEQNPSKRTDASVQYQVNSIQQYL